MMYRIVNGDVVIVVRYKRRQRGDKDNDNDSDNEEVARALTIFFVPFNPTNSS